MNPEQDKDKVETEELSLLNKENVSLLLFNFKIIIFLFFLYIRLYFLINHVILMKIMKKMGIFILNLIIFIKIKLVFLAFLTFPIIIMGLAVVMTITQSLIIQILTLLFLDGTDFYSSQF